jgi:hypothetical protein
MCCGVPVKKLLLAADVSIIFVRRVALLARDYWDL